MVAAAVDAYPQECCGLILGQRELDNNRCDHPQPEDDDRQVLDIVPVANAWEPSLLDDTDPSGTAEAGHGRRDRYWIDPTVMLGVQKSARQQQLEIIGIYHSHPDHPAVPSECDRTLAWPIYSYVILSVQLGTVADLTSWRLGPQQQFQPEPVKIIGTSANNSPFLS